MSCTVVECILQSQKLSESANTHYTRITVEAGAATKFYQVNWNNENEFKKVFIHLGDLHGFMKFFRMIGKLVSGGGFKRTIYQADMCTTGSVKRIISGQHYNRTWLVNECFENVTACLFCEKYMSLPQPLGVSIKTISEISLETLGPISETEELESYAETYAKTKKRVYRRNSNFWMQYLHAVERLHIQLVEMILIYGFKCGKKPFSDVSARYGTYIMQLKNLR